MKEKKKVSNWYNAFTLWLTAGFAIPLLVGIVTSLAAAPLFGPGSIMLPIVVAVATTLAIWPGVMYASSFLRKKYVIDDPEGIIKMAVIILVVMSIIGLVLALTGDMKTFLVNLPLRIAGIVLLYFASKKYLTRNV